MTRYAYDTEFLEDGKTIELISIGIVADDGREYYAVNRDAPWRRIKKHDWLVSNVVPSLPKLYGDARLHYARRGPLGLIDWQSPHMKRRARIADDVRDFLLAGDGSPELWAWYGAYDHVALCQLWGPMIDLPDGLPMWTNDLKQEVQRQGNPELPRQAGTEHNALDDARWVARALMEVSHDLHLDGRGQASA